MTLSALVSLALAGSVLSATPDRLPLSFEPNAGQTDARVRFLARTPAGTFFFTPREIVLAGGTRPLRLRFLGASSTARVEGGTRRPGTVNYLLGRDAEKWRTGLPTYSGVRYVDLYPGVALDYEAGGRPLKGTYTVAAGADPARIRWRYEGARTQVDEAGRLLVRMEGGPTLTEDPPVAWQEREGRREPVSARYARARDGSVGFALGAYDRAQPLVIDPVITYSTFLGGFSFDIAYSVATDAAGNAYIAGYTASSDFPTVNPRQPVAPGFGDAFVARFDLDGTPVYSTYLGGGYFDYATDIAVDAAGNAYLTGMTGSTDFPIANAFQPAYAGGWDAFVTKLDPTGATLVYSSYLGGSGQENRINAGTPGSIAVDSHGSAYVAGDTQSTDFPTANAFQPTLHGSIDGFVSKVSPDGSSLVYSTYLGGARGDTAWGIAVDGEGSAIVTGDTTSYDFPIANAFQPTCAVGYGGCWDVFVTRFDPSGTHLAYSTYLGGNDQEYIDRGFAVAVDGSGIAYVTGMTGSPNFPVLNPVQPVYGGQVDAFVARFARKGQLLSSTFFGGSNSEVGYGIAVEVPFPSPLPVPGPGNCRAGVHLSGLTLSDDFPVTNPIQATMGGFEDAFVAQFSPAVDQVVYSTYLGGTDGREEYGSTGLALDGRGGVWISGGSEATDYPTVNPFQSQPHGSYDAFLTRIDVCAGTPVKEGPAANAAAPPTPR